MERRSDGDRVSHGGNVVAAEGFDLASRVGLLECFDESLNHGELQEVVGDDEVVALLAERNKVEATGFCGGADADTRVCETECDGVGDGEVSLGGALVAVYGTRGEAGSGYESVHEGSAAGTLLPVDEGEVGAGEVVDGSDVLGVVGSYDKALLPNGEGDNRTGEGSEASDPGYVVLSSSLVKQVTASDVGRPRRQVGEGGVAVLAESDHAEVSEGQVSREEGDGRVTAGQDEGIGLVQGGQESDRYIVWGIGSRSNAVGGGHGVTGGATTGEGTGKKPAAYREELDSGGYGGGVGRGEQLGPDSAALFER